MQFSIVCDVLLLNSVTTVDAHLAAHSHSEKELRSSSCNNFLLPSPIHLVNMNIPLSNALSNRLQKYCRSSNGCEEVRSCF